MVRSRFGTSPARHGVSATLKLGSLAAEWIHFTLFAIIFINITHYKTESVDFWGLMNSATRALGGLIFLWFAVSWFRGLGI